MEPFEKLMTAGMGQTRFHSLRSLESIVHGGLLAVYSVVCGIFTSKSVQVC